jgi:hypothetical protein
MPPEEERLAKITNPKTRRAYKEDAREFVDAGHDPNPQRAKLCELIDCRTRITLQRGPFLLRPFS